MAKVLVNESSLSSIADAIREKLGVSETYKPSEMGLAIKNIDYKTLLVDNPEYFINETIDTAKKINALHNEHTFIAYFITDTHAHTSSNNMQYVDAQLASMHAIAKVIKPDLVIHGGDLVNGSESKDITVNEIKHIIKQMRDIGGNDTHILMGNHDGNTYAGSTQEEIESNRITENEMLTLSRAWDDGFTYAGDEYQGGNFYGYRDYSTLNLRIIRLHSYRENINNADYNGGKGQNWGYYEDEQTWFKNVALNTNNDILIFCHQSLAPVLQGFSDAQDIPHGGTIMQQALDTWLEADSNHRCIGVVHGHVHWDYSAKGKGTFNVIDHESKETITRIGNHGNFYEYGLCLANYLPSYSTTDITPISGYRDVPIGAIQRGRAVETKTQGLWTAIIVDTNAETINFIRFGAGVDQTYSYSAPKINQLPLATDTDGTVYNGIGYKENTRLNSSGNITATNGIYATGFIPVTAGQTVTFKNIQLDADNSMTDYSLQYITFYDSNKTLLANCSMYARNWIVDLPALVQPYTLDGTNLISITPHGTQGTRDLANVAFMRISAKLINGTSAIYVE